MLQIDSFPRKLTQCITTLGDSYKSLDIFEHKAGTKYRKLTRTKALIIAVFRLLHEIT